MAPTPISVNQAAKATPSRYLFAGGGGVSLEAGYAEFDGAAAGGSFLPSLAVYAPSGVLLGRGFPADAVVAGDSAKVTFAPFQIGGGAAAPGTTPVFKSTSISTIGNRTVLAGATIDELINCSHFNTGLPTYFQQNAGGQALDCLITSNWNCYAVVRIYSNAVDKKIPTSLAFGITNWDTASGAPGTTFVADQDKQILPANALDSHFGSLTNFGYWLHINFSDLAVVGGFSYGLWISAQDAPSDWLYNGAALFLKRFSNWY